MRHKDGRLQISVFDDTKQMSQDGSFHLHAVTDGAPPHTSNGGAVSGIPRFESGDVIVVDSVRRTEESGGGVDAVVVSNLSPLIDTDGNIMVSVLLWIGASRAIANTP